MTFRWRIVHKLAFGLVLVVAMISLLGFGSYSGLSAYRRGNVITTFHHQQIVRLENLQKAMFEITARPAEERELAFETGGPTADGKEVRLQRIERLIDDFRSDLESTAADIISPEAVAVQLKELTTLARLVDALRKTPSRKAQRIGETNSPNSDQNPADGNQDLANASTSRANYWNWWHTEQDKNILLSMTAAVNRLEGEVHNHVRSHLASDAASYRFSASLVLATSILAVVMLFGLVVLIYNSIFHPIRNLHLGVMKLAKGKFDSRVEVNSNDEMRELADSFNEMADHLQQIYRDLNRQVEERSRQLIRSERLASVGFLAAGVAHEINNPLASIAFCSEALESRLGPYFEHEKSDSEVVRNYLRMIQDEAFRCKTITEKLLNFSRVGEPERIDTNLVVLIRDVLEMVQHLGKSKHKTVIFEPIDEVIANVNPPEFKQVMLNLIVNALESIEEGGTVEITARRKEKGAEIIVRDDGCGMTPDVLENLFEPFFTRSRTGKGTGLGLSISHLIVSRHGGVLEAASDGPNRGSSFRITLPASKRAVMAMAA